MADRDVARLRALGFSFRQIAGELGLSLGGAQRALRRAGVRPAAQVVGDREGRISELFDALYDEDGSVNELTLHRLRYWLAPPDYELLCEAGWAAGPQPEVLMLVVAGQQPRVAFGGQRHFLGHLEATEHRFEAIRTQAHRPRMRLVERHLLGGDVGFGVVDAAVLAHVTSSPPSSRA